MKILPLIERIVDTKITDQKYNGKLRRSDKFYDNRTAFSTGKPSKTEPHVFQKHGSLPLNTSERGSTSNPTVDGYDVFMRYLVEHDIDNPHFPVVYSIKKITDNRGAYINKFKVEQLIDLVDLEMEELVDLFHANFDRPKVRYRDKEDIASSMSSTISYSIHDREYVKLESLSEAFDIIKTVAKQEDLRTDLHRENIMARRTNKGLQLVLSDPFSYKNSEY